MLTKSKYGSSQFPPKVVPLTKHQPPEPPQLFAMLSTIDAKNRRLTVLNVLIFCVECDLR